MSAALKEVPAPSPESERIAQLEYLLDVLVGALSRITVRTMDADSDMGQRVMVRGAIAHGALATVRGIAEEALEVACAEVEKS